jgi:hypothetical protein
MEITHMSKQTIARVTESRYHKGTFSIILSCGCDYTVKENVKIGYEANCPRCPMTVPLKPKPLTFNEARTLVSGDQVEWSDGTIGVVGFDHKTYVSYVDWPDGHRTLLNDVGALPHMRVVKKSATVNGLPR